MAGWRTSDVDDVRAIEVGGFPEDGLLAVVVLVRVELELKVEMAVGVRGGDGALQAPAAERPGRSL